MLGGVLGGGASAEVDPEKSAGEAGGSLGEQIDDAVELGGEDDLVDLGDYGFEVAFFIVGRQCGQVLYYLGLLGHEGLHLFVAAAVGHRLGQHILQCLQEYLDITLVHILPFFLLHLPLLPDYLFHRLDVLVLLLSQLHGPLLMVPSPLECLLAV